MQKSLSFLIACFIALCTQAQIQRKFMGQTLGVSTKTEVLSSLSSKGGYLSTVNGKEVVALKNYSFGGYTWGLIMFQFSKEIFSEILMMESEFTPDEIKDAKYKSLVKQLDDKYGQYKISDDQEDTKGYSDGSTCLVILNRGIYFLMGYSDEEISNKVAKEGADEL